MASDDANNSKPPLTSEQKLINGWAEGLIMRCQQTMNIKPQNDACIKEIMHQGYKLRTREFWAKRGFLEPKK